MSRISSLFHAFPLAASIAVLSIMALGACSPEVGSKEWCDDLKEKPKGDWTANEAADFARESRVGWSILVAGVGGESDRRDQIRTRDPVSLAYFLHPCHRFAQIQVGGKSRVHQRFEDRIVVHGPPALRLTDQAVGSSGRSACAVGDLSRVLRWEVDNDGRRPGFRSEGAGSDEYQ